MNYLNLIYLKIIFFVLVVISQYCLFICQYKKTQQNIFCEVFLYWKMKVCAVRISTSCYLFFTDKQYLSQILILRKKEIFLVRIVFLSSKHGLGQTAIARPKEK